MTKNVPAEIVIYVKDKGITLREKSLIAISGSKVIAYGNDCESAFAVPATESESLTVLSPFKQGKITDFTPAVALLKYLIKKANGNKKSWKKPVIGIVLPENSTEIDKKAYEDALYMSGAKEALLFHEHEPLEKIIHQLPETYRKKMDILIGIEGNPMEYVKEAVSDLLTYCEKNHVSRETVIGLLSEGEGKQ
ncbi:MAG: rod shape-determining protein [Clostridium sp.]|nr:rod shape-determining protein [Clostridium sp.]